MKLYLTNSLLSTIKHTFELDAAFTTSDFDITDSTNTINIRIHSADANGTGTITLQYSNDRENWETVTNDAGNDCEWAIDGTDVDGIDIKAPSVGWYRLKYAKGTNTAGSLFIVVGV